MNNYFFLIFGIVAGLLVGLVTYLLLNKKNQSQQIADSLEEKLNLILPKITQMAGDQTALLAKEKLEASSKEIGKELEAKKELIDETLKRIKTDLIEANAKLEKAEFAREGTFQKLSEQLSAQKEQVEHLRKSADGLRSVLSNNQMRGAFGEQIAEDLLKMAGFTKGIDYDAQTGDGEGRPDFAVKLPNGMRINVDVKFPYNNLQKSTETENKSEKEAHLKAFERDIREKIKQVTSRSYIDVEKDTVDFVVLFVPNELIFSYIYDKMNDTWMEAMKQKVVLAGPFSFTAILRMIRQAYETFHIQSNIASIITQIKVFGEEFSKYSEEFEKIGDRIDSLHKQYSLVSQTRTRQLQRVVDKIALDEVTEQQKLLS